MKRKNATRNALITSILSLLLCVSMLVGTTLAWFTDEVTSGINTIQSGNLDVVLEYKTNWDSDWAPVTSETKVFKDGALYEPGYTEVVFLRVSNAGSLALKYNLTVNVAAETGSTNVKDEEFLLSEHLQVGSYIQDEFSGEFNYADVLIPAMFGTRETALSNVTLGKLSDFDGSLAQGRPLLPGEETAQVVALVLTMPETVGNEANHKTGVEAPSIQLGVNLIAAQLTHEEDSFDNQYDAGAEYTQPEEDNTLTISTIAELREAAANGGTYKLVNDLSMDDSEAAIEVSSEFVFNLNGFNLDFSARTTRPFTMAEGASFTINAGDVEIIAGQSGFINIKKPSTVIVNGGNFSGNVASGTTGALVRITSAGKTTVEFNDVNYTTAGNAIVIDSSGYTGNNEDLNIAVNGGYFKTGYMGFFVNGNTTIKDATIIAEPANSNASTAGVYASKGNGVKIDNCKITSTGTGKDACGVGVAEGGYLTITKSEIVAASDYSLRVFSSGGTIDITDSTFTDSKYYIAGKTHNADAVVIVNGEEVYRKAAS